VIAVRGGSENQDGHGCSVEQSRVRSDKGPPRETVSMSGLHLDLLVESESSANYESSEEDCDGS
jgi:hypothetical protein